MKLWIRSQDKLDLMKCKSIHIEEIPSSTKVAILCYASGDKYSTIGYYKSKERALEILDEIQNILKPQEYEIEKGNGYYTKSTNISTYVYEMPED